MSEMTWWDSGPLVWPTEARTFCASASYSGK